MTMIYFHRALNPEVIEARKNFEGPWYDDHIENKVLGILAFPLLIYFIWIEFNQVMSKKRKSEYFQELFNWIDITGVSLTLAIYIVTMSDQEWISFEQMRIMAAIASLALLFKIFDWLRLFEDTAFYILLIENTLNDVMGFLAIFFLALITIGMPMHFLDLNRAYRGDDELIEPAFNFWIADAMYNQYLLSLGEFASLENMGDGAAHEKLVLLFFSFATFFTQITMLNMLIAIMGDSFAYATENKEMFSIQTKLDILSTQAPSLP